MPDDQLTALRALEVVPLVALLRRLRPALLPTDALHFWTEVHWLRIQERRLSHAEREYSRQWIARHYPPREDHRKSIPIG